MNEPIYPTLAALLKYASPAKTFVDIGAHHGLFSKAFAEADMWVIAVEPFPDNIYHFLMATKAFRIPCIPAAMSDRDGTALLYNGGPSTVHSLIPGIAQEFFPTQQPAELPPPITVKTICWRTLCITFGIEDVDILKLDAKWNNLAVLNSMVAAKGPFPRVICTEVRREDRHEIVHLLDGAGYDFRESVALDGERMIFDEIYVKRGAD